MKTLVTGGSGLIGRYIVDALVERYEVDVLDLKKPHRDDVRWHRGDVLNWDEVLRVVLAYDAVVHLAGIPHPLDHPAETVYRVNVLGTYNVLEACAAAKISRFILMSSESTLGFAFSSTRRWPEFLPIDESHPTRPEDSYGLSKLTGEMLCAAFTRRTGMCTICLRPPWVWVPEEQEIALYRSLIREYVSWPRNLWAYIHVLDLAQAVLLALDARLQSLHDVFFVCADDNWTGRDSRELVQQFFPETTNIAPTFSGPCSLISNARARAVLGFDPKHSWKEFAGE